MSAPARAAFRRRSIASGARFTGLACIVVFLGGCGTNKPELPPGLGSKESCVVIGYPDGPYGSQPGAIGRNVCFRGWRAPDKVARDPSQLEDVALSDYFDPDGSRGVALLMVNTAAVWCSACRIEHETLGDYANKYRSRGLVIVSALFQDQDGNPASFDDLSAWADMFGTNFPFVLDPNYSFGAYASAETAPLNLIFDANSMTLLERFIGDQPGALWPFVEAELARKAR